MENTKAQIYYEKHLKYMRDYTQKNKEKGIERSKLAYKEIKADPEKYKLYLERKRELYKLNKTKKSDNVVDLPVSI